MNHLSTKTQNTKGSEPKYKENLGLVTTFIRHSNDFIVVDDYKGRGNNYTQRELTEIRVYENGSLIFMGDKYELFEKLKK